MEKLHAILRTLDYKRLAIGAVLGALLGYLYYAFIGCTNGSCAITSSPINSTLYGILIGITLAFREKPQAKKDKN